MHTNQRLVTYFAYIYIILYLPTVALGYSTTLCFGQHHRKQIQKHAVSKFSDASTRELDDDDGRRLSEGTFSRSRRGYISKFVVAVASCSVVAVSAPSKSIAKTEPALIDNLVNDNLPISESQQLLISRIRNEPSAFQESISGFVSGSLVSTTKTLVKYPLDTATVRLQMPNTQFSIKDLPRLFTGSFDGITAPLVSNIPAGAVFFAAKDATKSLLKDSGLALPKWALTTLAVGAAQPLYWLLRNPSEVIKTRLQVGAEGYYEGMSTINAFQQALSKGGSNSTMDGLGDLYQGYTENILYAFPADIIKFVVYDALAGGKGNANVSPVDGAVYGALSTAISQLATTPLDVLRNRIMAEVSGASNTSESVPYFDRLSRIVKEEGAGVLFTGSLPRVAKAMLSGAIQFATYEETKQKMNELFQKR